MHKRFNPQSIAGAAGFSLVEVLIAMLLAALCLLGLVLSQVKALQYASSSLAYTVATVQVQNAVERAWPALCALQRAELSYDAVLQQQWLPLAGRDPQGFVVSLPTPAAFDFTATPYSYSTPLPGAIPLPPPGSATPALPNSFLIQVSWNDARFNDNQANTLNIDTSFPWLRNGGAC